ncbi:MAG TPA: N-acetylmuramidase family protein [Terriglobia bacterium]|nr:N-acetylmuramidase family protein [Terriglobia bacterium]
MAYDYLKNMILKSSVGRGGTNERNDVVTVQQLLRAAGFYQNNVDGLCGPQTVAAISQFQAAFLANADGCIDPGGPTWKRLVAHREMATETASDLPGVLTETDYEEAAKLLGCEVAAIKAVAEVESAGAGFLKDGRPRILFEGHWFYRHTKGAYAATHPTLCHPSQTNQHYCKGNAEERGAGELARLERAKQLDSGAALLSCSIGKFQVMGFNHKLCGFDTVEDFWQTLAQGEAAQLKAFCAFVKKRGLADHLVHHRWDKFAEGYNGKNYKKFSYDTKIAKAYEKFKSLAQSAEA